MMWRATTVALICALAVAMPARGAPLRSPDAVLSAMEKPMSEGDIDAIYVLLAGALRDARVAGWLTPDWAIFYAIQADTSRNQHANPAYALQLAEDGLALIAGDPDYGGEAAALTVSRAYALADLGRFDEAAETALLALPRFRQDWGQDAARELETTARGWARGLLSEYNTSAIELSRGTMQRAYAASETGAHGRAISLAASAILPPGGDLAENEVRSINFEAELLIADSLAALGRTGDSVNALIRAINQMTRAPWQPGQPGQPEQPAQPEQPIDWWPTWREEDRPVLFRVLTDLSTRALLSDQSLIGAQALQLAAQFTTDSDSRNTLLLRQAGLAFHSGKIDAALEQISRTRKDAQAAGDRDLVVMSDFYTAFVTARQVIRQGQTPDPAPILAAVDAALMQGSQSGGINRLLVLEDAARILAATTNQGRANDRALDYAREVLQAHQREVAQRGDTRFARTQARSGARRKIETFLRAAHSAAGGTDPARGENCPANLDYASCTVVAPTLPGSD